MNHTASIEVGHGHWPARYQQPGHTMTAAVQAGASPITCAERS